MRINLTFKNNIREIELYDIINSKINKSAFIKECIEFYLKHNPNELETSTIINNKNIEEENNWDSILD